jgi:sorbitol-specific phosphotransferase system component IIBC
MALWEKIKHALIGEPPSEEELRSIRSKTESSAGATTAKTDAWSMAAAGPDTASSGQYRRVRIERGARGWGGPLIIAPRPGKDLIYCVTGGGIHPVAQRIADLTGGVAFDGFKSKADFDRIAVAVIDCGGTARIGVYPMKGVPTVDIHGASPSGPLMKHIREDIFVSGITPEMIRLLDDTNDGKGS